MDRRLVLEFLPGAAFLLGNAVAGLVWAAAVAVAATTLAVALRWRWDGRMPWLAVSTLALALVLTGFGVTLNNETLVLVRPTVGALAFAAIIALGALARPSLLQQTLGYRLRIEQQGWRVLHRAWIALAVLSALANEVTRRALTTDQWAIYNALSDPALFGLIWVATRSVAKRHWVGEAEA